MALPPTIYRAHIELADLERHCYQSLQVTVARHPSETAERLVARLLAYALCYEEGLSFTRGICAGDEPDLWSHAPDGRVRLWLEVGLPEADRLLKASRHAERVALLACGSGLPRWLANQAPKLVRAPNLQLLQLAPELLDQLVGQLQRSINWALTVTEGRLYLSAGETTLESPLERHGLDQFAKPSGNFS